MPDKEWKDFLSDVKPLNKRGDVGFEGDEPDKFKQNNDFENLKDNKRLEVSSNLVSKGQKTLSGGFLECSDFSQIDGSYIKKFTKGTFPPDSIIDLHGYRLHEAEESFFEFIDSCYNKKLRNLLVITGKGFKGDGSVGAIKSSISKWINSDFLRHKILAYSTAHKKHGGEGAYYILLKK